MCQLHYQRWHTHGDPLTTNTPPGSTQRTFDELVALETDECILWPLGRTTAGYGVMNIGQRRKAYVHVRALEVRVGERPPGMEAAHGECHNPACMNYRHLRWATPLENQRDKVRDGTLNIGHRNGRVKLTEEDVRTIRAEYASGGVRQKELAERYGVHQVTISQIVLRKSWDWVA